MTLKQNQMTIQIRTQMTSLNRMLQCTTIVVHKNMKKKIRWKKEEKSDVIETR